MTNIYLKDGQQPPNEIQYQFGNLHKWKYDGEVNETTALAYRKGFSKKTDVMFADGVDNNFLTAVYKKEGKVFPKEDHWVDVYGYLTMTVVWKPSKTVKYVRYTARDHTLYKYLKKHYPTGKWMSNETPAWVRQR